MIEGRKRGRNDDEQQPNTRNDYDEQQPNKKRQRNDDYNKMLCSLRDKAQPMTNSACKLLNKSSFPPIQWCQGKSNVYALPVGQGDCTVITCPKTQTQDIVMFDCGSISGNRMEKDTVRDFLQLPSVGRITVIISHLDNDHHSYIEEVFQSRNDVHLVVANTDPIQNSNWKVHQVNNGNHCIGDCNLPPAPFCGVSSQLKFEILASNVGGSKNQQSIVMKVTYGSGLSLLLSGDMEGEAMKTIVKEVGDRLPSYYYKIAHHGAASEGLKGNPSSYISQWLKAIYPTNTGELFVSHALKNNITSTTLAVSHSPPLMELPTRKAVQPLSKTQSIHFTVSTKISLNLQQSRTSVCSAPLPRQTNCVSFILG